MTSAAELAIRVTSDARKGIAGIDETTKRASRMGKVGRLAGKALAAGLLAGAVAAGSLAQGAADDAAAAAKMAQAYKSTAHATDAQVASTEKWISAAGKALGVTDDELRPALTQLVTATHSVGKAQKLAGLAMNISARSGKSLQSVSAALAKAQTTGNVAALAKYGVATKDAHGKTKSLERVTRELAATYKGSAAASAETVSGKWARAKLQLSELGEAIGYKLIPAMLKASEYGLQAVDWIEKNQRVVAYLVVGIGSLLAITFAVSKAMQAWRAITTAVTAVQWALNVALNANPVSLIVLAVFALAAALVIAYKRSETFRAIVDKSFRAVQQIAGAVIGWIRDHWRVLFVVLTGPIGLAVLTIIKHRSRIIAALSGAIGWIRDHWQALLAILLGPFGLAVGKIIVHRDRILTVLRNAIDWVRDNWHTISGILTGPFDNAVAAAKKIISTVDTIITKIKSIPTPHIDLNPLNRVARGGKGGYFGGSTLTPPASGGGGDTYNIDLRSPIVDDRAVDRLMQLLNDKARRTGGVVVVR